MLDSIKVIIEKMKANELDGSAPHGNRTVKYNLKYFKGEYNRKRGYYLTLVSGVESADGQVFNYALHDDSMQMFVHECTRKSKKAEQQAVDVALFELENNPVFEQRLNRSLAANS